MMMIVYVALVVLMIPLGLTVYVGVRTHLKPAHPRVCCCYRFTENQPHMWRCPEARKERELATKLARFQKEAAHKLCYGDCAEMEKEIYDGDVYTDTTTGKTFIDGPKNLRKDLERRAKLGIPAIPGGYDGYTTCRYEGCYKHHRGRYGSGWL